ncbi:hypothetical protein [Micromonospora haikouensis]|uniref:hypothetical protein n=1 Tax=Micromonospora haikouensis TaxID=686309 RepID=UPI0037AE938B
MTAEPAAERIVLKPNVGLPDVEEAAFDLQWLLVRHWDASDERPYEDVWVDANEAGSIHYLDDHMVDLRYLTFRGPNSAQNADDARAALATYSSEEALSVFVSAQTVDERVQAVYLAALGATQHRPAVSSILEEAVEDDQVAVRHAVAVAIAYLGWPSLGGLLERLRHDADESVRSGADLVHEGLTEERR